MIDYRIFNIATFFIENLNISRYLSSMSPTVFRYKNYRFYFFSREEERVHIHIYCPDGEAKFWITPVIELANNYGLKDEQLSEIKKVIEDQKNAIIEAWNRHFRD